jgi:hypothetical protein
LQGRCQGVVTDFIRRHCSWRIEGGAVRQRTLQAIAFHIRPE